MSRRRQRLAASVSALALLVVGLGVSATRADAVVTATTITSSSYPATFTLLAGGRTAAAQNAPGLELDGTYQRSGSSGDGVDTQCYAGTSNSLVGSQPGSDGRFAVSGAAPVGSICDLRAVPSGTVPSGGALLNYPALRRSFGYAGAAPESASTASAAPADSGLPTAPSGPSAPPAGSAPSPNASTPVHVQAGLPDASAVDTLGDAVATGAAPGGGLVSTLLDGGLTPGPGSVFGAAGVIPSDGATTSRVQTQQGGVRVDGVNVLTPGAAADIWGTDAGQPGFGGSVSVMSSIEGSTGDATVITSEPLLACPDTSLPATKATCPSFRPVGVTLTRSTTTSQGGRVVRVTDTFGSPAAHAITLDYEHAVTSSSTGSTDPGPEFSTDSGGTFVPGVQGQRLPVPSAPFSVLVKTSGDPTSFAHPGGSVTYSTQPASATVANGGTTLVTHYDRQIPAGGQFTLTHSYVSSDSDAAVASLSRLAMMQGLAPSISLAVPASVSRRNVTVGGVVTPGQNGLPQTVIGSTGATATVDQTTGIFAVPAVLQPGLQTLSVTAVDAVGQTATQSATVSYDNPLTAGRLDDYLVFGTHLVMVKKPVGRKYKVLKVRVRYVSGVRLQVPLHCSSLATSACTAKIKVVDRGRTIKTVTFTRGPGYRPVLSILLSSVGYNAAHFPRPTKAHPHPRPANWVIGVTVSYTDPDGSTYPGSRAATLRV